MKVDLVTTWNTNCGMAYYSRYLSEALSKHVNVKICRVDPSFTPEEFACAIKKCDGDIVHIEHEWGIYCGQETLIIDILHKKRVPIVLTAHGGGYQNFLGKVDKITLPNESQRDPRHTSIIPIIPHGVTHYEKVDREKAKQELGITKLHVITQWGFILPHKCYELVINTIKDQTNVCYLIAGSEERNLPYWLHLQKLMKENNFKPEVIKTGFIPEETISTVFGATDLCVFPYLTGVDSGCLRYALGSGVVCLSSPAPFIQEIFTKYGVPFLSKTPWDKNFGLAIRQLLERTDYTDYEDRCKTFAEKNSWENVAEQHVKVYEEVLAK